MSKKSDSLSLNQRSCVEEPAELVFFKPAMKLKLDRIRTKGQIEDLIAKEVTKFYSKTLGVGPSESKVYILEDMIIVRLRGQLLPIEQNLLALSNKKGIELVKNIRQALHEITTKKLSTLMKKISGHKVISSHSDISTKTGERIEIFILGVDYERELMLKFPESQP